MAIRLFDIAGTCVPLEGQLPIVETPLGQISLRLLMGWSDQSNFSRINYSIGEERYAAEWFCAEAYVEMLFGKVRIKTPNDLVDFCWAVVYRVEAVKDIHEVRASATWIAPWRWTEYDGPHTGEHLECSQWCTRDDLVCIGTEDVQALSGRAHRGEWMPRRLEKVFVDEARTAYPWYTTAEYSPDRFATLTPAIAAGERCQLHFVIASQAFSQDKEELEPYSCHNDAWWVVDQDASTLVKRLEGRIVSP